MAISGTSLPIDANTCAILSGACYNGTPSNISYIDGVPAHHMDPEIMNFRRVVHWLDLYFVPCLAVVGIIGNLLSFMVFMATYLKHMSSSVFLAGLAISDCVFLFVVLISWANNVGNHIYHQHGWCHLFVYLGYVSSFLSVWYVVCFTIERHIAVCFPLKRHNWCTTKRARIIVITIAVFALLAYTFALWTSEVNSYYKRPFCSVKSKYYQVVATINNADTLITLILPTVIIILCNIRIVWALARFFIRSWHEPMNTRSSVRMLSLAKDSPTPSTVSIASAHSVHNKRGSRMSMRYIQSSSYSGLQMKVTKMLLIISTAFLICNTPSHAIRVYVFFKSLTDPDYVPSHKFVLVQKTVQFVYYSNFSINFLLYNISGQAFRKAMFCLIKKTKEKLRNLIRLIYTRSPLSDCSRFKLWGAR